MESVLWFPSPPQFQTRGSAVPLNFTPFPAVATNCGMQCINSHNPPSPLFSQHSKYNHQIWLPNRLSIVQVNRSGFSLVILRTKALPSPTFLATTLPSTGKLSVLIQTSAVCLLAYWVANFVVPEIILKDLQSNKKNDSSPPEDER